MSSQDLVRRNIREMQGYVSGEQPDTAKFIKLNTNENPFPPSAKVVEAIRSAALGNLNVYPDALSSAFRIAASEILQIEPTNILCGNGSDDILTMLTRTFVDAGDWIRIPYPSYVLYRTLAAIQGAQTEEIHFNSDWSLPAEFARTDKTPSLVFLPNPNSPSGTAVPLEEISKLAESLPCPLVVDEAYADFAETNSLELVRQHENLIVTRSLSKSYGLAGLRFGFAIASESIIAEMQKVKDSYNCDSLSIAGATAAIQDTDWLNENRQKIIKLRSELDRDLVELGFHTVPSQANFIWCQHPNHPALSLYEQLKRNHILVRYMDYPNWGDGLRISVGTANQNSALKTILGSIID